MPPFSNYPASPGGGGFDSARFWGRDRTTRSATVSPVRHVMTASGRPSLTRGKSRPCPPPAASRLTRVPANLELLQSPGFSRILDGHSPGVEEAARMSSPGPATGTIGLGPSRSSPYPAEWVPPPYPGPGAPADHPSRMISRMRRLDLEEARRRSPPHLRRIENQ